MENPAKHSEEIKQPLIEQKEQSSLKRTCFVPYIVIPNEEQQLNKQKPIEANNVVNDVIVPIDNTQSFFKDNIKNTTFTNIKSTNNTNKNDNFKFDNNLLFSCTKTGNNNKFELTVKKSIKSSLLGKKTCHHNTKTNTRKTDPVLEFFETYENRTIDNETLKTKIWLMCKLIYTPNKKTIFTETRDIGKNSKINDIVVNTCLPFLYDHYNDGFIIDFYSFANILHNIDCNFCNAINELSIFRKNFKNKKMPSKLVTQQEVSMQVLDMFSTNSKTLQVNISKFLNLLFFYRALKSDDITYINSTMGKKEVLLRKMSDICLSRNKILLLSRLEEILYCYVAIQAGVSSAINKNLVVEPKGSLNTNGFVVL